MPFPPPPPGERRRYAPLTPSPLNPNTYLTNTKIRPQQQQQQQHHSHPSTSPNKTNNNNRPQKPDPATQNPSSSTLPQKYTALAHASPTQRLLRQKAAAAWRRSEILRIRHLHHHHPVLFPGQPLSAAEEGRLRREGSRGQDQDQLLLLPLPLGEYPPSSSSSSSAGHRSRGRGRGSRGAKGEKPLAAGTAPKFEPAPGSGSEAGRGWDADFMTVPIPDEEEQGDDAEGGDIGLGISIGSGADGGGGGGEEATGADAPGYPYRDGFCAGVGDDGFPLERAGSRDGLLLPLHAAVAKRAGRRHVRGGDGLGGGGGGGVTMRRFLFMVALFLGMGLVHGLVSAFGSVGGGGGRPQPGR